MALSDLYLLGPCLASVLPDAYFSQLGASTFVSYYSTLGNAFQPTATQITMVTAYITQFLTNSTLMANSTRDTFAFATLGDLAMFYPWTSSNYATMVSNNTVRIKINSFNRDKFPFPLGFLIFSSYFVKNLMGRFF